MRTLHVVSRALMITAVAFVASCGYSTDVYAPSQESPLKINEVFPNGDIPGGWVEIFNPTAYDIDMGGWRVTAGDVSRSFMVPAGAVIPAQGFLAVNEGNFPLGLKSADAVHLFSPSGVEVDSFSWTVNPATSYGRCADGSGQFVVTTTATRKSANDCPTPGAG